MNWSPRSTIACFCKEQIADRGMISAETMAELEARRLLYIGALAAPIAIVINYLVNRTVEDGSDTRRRNA